MFRQSLWTVPGPLFAVAILSLSASTVATANEVIRTQVTDTDASCDQWVAARKGNSIRRRELEAMVRGYSEGVAAHIEGGPKERFEILTLFKEIDSYCSTYSDGLFAAAEIQLEHDWPALGDKLGRAGIEKPAPRNSYIGPFPWPGTP